VAQGTYLFIDGNYLEERYAAKMKTFFGDGGELDYAQLRHDRMWPDLQRAFYYNAIDYGSRDNETPDATAERVKMREDWFDEIDAIADFHVRPGSVTSASRKRRAQKKVDALIAVDMLTNAHNHNMSQAVLIAGDLDFAPLVAAVVRLGIRVSVVFDQASVSRELTEEADRAGALRLRDYYRWSSDFYKLANPIPDEQQIKGTDYRETRPDRVEIGGGLWGGRAVRLLHLTNGNFFAVAIRDELTQMNTIITDQSKERLLKYVVVEYPAVTWS
jgi:uncharacterized LabA/DUF88 family protein